MGGSFPSRQAAPQTAPSAKQASGRPSMRFSMFSAMVSVAFCDFSIAQCCCLCRPSHQQSKAYVLPLWWLAIHSTSSSMAMWFASAVATRLSAASRVAPSGGCAFSSAVSTHSTLACLSGGGSGRGGSAAGGCGCFGICMLLSPFVGGSQICEQLQHGGCGCDPVALAHVAQAACLAFCR